MLSLLLVGRKKRERETARVVFFFFSPRAGHTLLAVPHRIFAAVR
jgi:hypothetical protein